VSILHVESVETRGDKGLLAKTEDGDSAGTSAGACTVFLPVDFNAEELVCLSEIRDLRIFLGAWP
jgi:hypothetical protein